MTNKINLLYEELSYKVRGAIIAIHKALGSGHKETVYHQALIEEFNKNCIKFTREQKIPILYNTVKVGTYQPDFIIEDKILLEIKAVPFISINHTNQLKHYLSGSDYNLGFLVNFGESKAKIIRILSGKYNPVK